MSRRAPRLKWHMLRRRRSDPAFLRENLDAALRTGAACEVDIVFSADGHAFCLHDLDLDRETTGRNSAASATRAEIERLKQRGARGEALDSAPLFLDEIVARAKHAGASAPGAIQLDVKAPLASLSEDVLLRLRATLGDQAPLFIAGGYDWQAILRLRAAIPGLEAGFDPLALYPRTLGLDADACRALGERTLAIAPDASTFYLEGDLVLAALDCGVNLIEAVRANGAAVDVWTFDADRPNLHRDLGRAIDAGCDQITSNDPDALASLIGDLAA